MSEESGFLRSSWKGAEGNRVSLVHTKQLNLFPKEIHIEVPTRIEKITRFFRCSRCKQLYHRGKGLLSLILCPSCRASGVV